MKNSNLPNTIFVKKIKSKLSPSTFRNIFSFYNEIRFYKFMEGSSSLNFKTPNLIGCSYKELQLSYIEGEKGFDIDKHGWEKYLDALSEFALLNFNSSYNFKNQIFSPTTSHIYSILIKLLKGNFNLFYSHSNLLLRYLIRPPETKGRFLIHKDLRLDQNIMINDDNIYLFDFESVTDSNKFLLTDVIQIIFDTEKNKILWYRLNYYLNRIDAKKAYTIKKIIIEIKLHLLKEIDIIDKNSSQYRRITQFISEKNNER